MLFIALFVSNKLRSLINQLALQFVIVLGVQIQLDYACNESVGEFSSSLNFSSKDMAIADLFSFMPSRTLLLDVL